MFTPNLSNTFLLMKQISYQLHDLPKVVKFILDNTKSKIILFDGPMGSGKTTLIKALVKELGATDEASSPTFSIVNEYVTPQHKIYHFDLYRLKDFYEALDFGIEEYLDDSQAYVFIEWPDIIEPILPENSQKIRIIVKDNKTRDLQIL